jgi:chemotaxis family two-component system sensor kinase Cph1
VPFDDDLLRRCESEPIHIPGAIQPHGVLLLVDRAGFVRAASENHELIGAGNPNPLGRPLTTVLGDDVVAELLAATAEEPTSITTATGETFDVVVHHLAGDTLIELESPTAVDMNERTALSRLLRTLQSAETVDQLLDRVVATVRELTGFDRVMLYEFDAEWNGLVAAESVAEGHGAFLGLRYPASDIPPQARALYLRNRVRLIPDVSVAAVTLARDPVLGDTPIDLTDCTLRAVSPVHLEYLRNMGVAASASVALILHGDLWGLVACHHYSGPRRPSQRIRTTLDVLAGTAAAMLVGLNATAAAIDRLALVNQLDEVARPLLDEESSDPLSGLSPSELLAFMAADGVVVTSLGQAAIRGGQAPPDDAVDEFCAWLAERGGPEFASAHLSSDAVAPNEPPRPPLADVAGVVAVRWGGEKDWVLWFREEQIRSVRWGGDPGAKEIVHDPFGARLGPRRSFTEFIETVRGTSRIWTEPEVDTAREFSRRLTAAALRRGHRNRTVAALMQQALMLDEVPAVPGVDVAVIFRPAQDDALGGDWYDVYFLPDGRAVVALGDVAGHGLEVAATMAQLRHALRAYVVREGDISQALGRLNDLSFSLLPGEMATLVVALVDPQARTLEVINAGHIPPVIGHVGGTSELIPLPRHPALGVARSVTYRATPVALGPGEVMVICTDGLIERRTESLDVQLDLLVASVGCSDGETSQATCNRLDLQFAPDGSDDMTVLALRFDHASQ